MKKYLILYKPFLLFLSKFFLTYIILMVLYQSYLNSFEGLKIDSITKMVAHNSGQILQLFDDNSAIVINKTETNIGLIYHQKKVARIIEGCNAMSVIILFIAFVVAFSGKLSITVLYILGGSVVIYILNIIRIALLAIALYWFPMQEHVLHGVIFPLVIYGVVFVLWVVWVNKFSKYAKKTLES